MMDGLYTAFTVVHSMGHVGEKKKKKKKRPLGTKAHKKFQSPKGRRKGKQGKLFLFSLYRYAAAIS